MPVPDYKPIDTCARCGLPRVTRELEEQGIMMLCDDCHKGRCIHLCIERQGEIVRLCDDCYWGHEFATSNPPTPVRKPETSAAGRPD